MRLLRRIPVFFCVRSNREFAILSRRTLVWQFPEQSYHGSNALMAL